jgi:hypothetical protein
MSMLCKRDHQSKLKQHNGIYQQTKQKKINKKK